MPLDEFDHIAGIDGDPPEPTLENPATFGDPGRWSRAQIGEHAGRLVAAELWGALEPPLICCLEEWARRGTLKPVEVLAILGPPLLETVAQHGEAATALLAELARETVRLHGSVLGMLNHPPAAWLLRRLEEIDLDSYGELHVDLLEHASWRGRPVAMLGQVLQASAELHAQRLYEEAEAQDKLPRPTRAMLERYWWIEGVKRYADARTGALLDDAQLNVRHADVGDPADHRNSAAAVFKRFARARGRLVDCLTYRPGGAPIVHEVRHGAERRCFNRWRPSSLKPPRTTISDDDVRPWLELVEHVVPDDAARAHVLDWMAYTAQHPDVKINHSLLITGEQRLGKDTMFVPLFRGIGLHNVVNITNDDLTGGWTDWVADKKIVTVQEIKAFMNGNAIANRLKIYQAAPPELVRVNGKNIPQYEVPNLINLVFFSNEERPIRIDGDDGRFFTYASPAGRREDGFYQRLWAWLDHEDGDASAMRWLLQRDVTDFNPARPAPMTASKAVLIEAGRGDLERFVEVFVRERRGVARHALVYLEELRRSLEQDAPKALVAKMTDEAIGRALRAIGCLKLGRVRLPNIGRRHLWAIHHPALVRRLIERRDAAIGRESTLTDLYRRERRQDDVSERRGTHRPIAW